MLVVADRPDQAAARGELLGQRRRDRGHRRRDVDRVVGRLGGMPERAVADQQRDVRGAGGGERRGRPLGQARMQLDAPDVRHEPREHRRVVARAGPDVEHALVAAQREQLAHARDHQRLGDRLPRADRQRDVVPRLLAPACGDEAVARHLADRRRAPAGRRRAGAAPRAGAPRARRRAVGYATARTRGPQLLEGSLGVARLDLHAPHRGRVDAHAESLAQRVARGVEDAVVRGEPDDRELVDAVPAQPLRQPGRVEARVAVRARVLALVDDRVDRAAVEVGVQLRALGVLHAVRRPRAALRRERAVVARVPVARGEHEVVVARGGVGVDGAGDLLAAGDRRARRPGGRSRSGSRR